MTRRNLAKSIIETVKNTEGLSENERIDAVSSLLQPLEPKDLKRFAAWGYNADISTPEKCWDL